MSPFQNCDFCRKFSEYFSGCNGTNVLDCCTTSKQCGVGEGDCKTDADCVGQLKCGKDNCDKSIFPADANCCYNPG